MAASDPAAQVREAADAAIEKIEAAIARDR
jgi:hypothetical protein